MIPTNPLLLAVAGRYAERHTIKQMLAEAKLDALPVVITASWLDCTEEGDADLTDEQAAERFRKNWREIANAHAMLYFPSWYTCTWGALTITDAPRWSPGRLIDYGLALACRVPIIIVGRPEPSIYFRVANLCEPETLRETVERVLNVSRATQP